MARLNQTFSANEGDKSIGTAGPTAIKADFDVLFTKLDADNVDGGITTSEIISVASGDRLDKVLNDMNVEIDKKTIFSSADAKYIRINADKVIETSTNGSVWQATDTITKGQLEAHAYSKVVIDGKLDAQKDIVEANLNITDGAIAKINDIANPKGNINIIGGTGVRIENDAVKKEVRLFATGVSEPTHHAHTHSTGGVDEITPESIGAATTAQGTNADNAIPKVDIVNSLDGGVDKVLSAEQGKVIHSLIPKKEDLLSDETALKFGLEGEEATVNKAFESIGDTPLHVPNNLALIRVIAQFSNGDPIVGAAVTGFTGLTDNITNEKGQLLVQLTTVTPITVDIPVVDYIDEKVSATAATPIFGKVTDVVMVATPINEVRILTSREFKISSAVAAVDVFLVGGGAGGSKGSFYYHDSYEGGQGGCGGRTATVINAPFISGYAYTAVVGGGGAGGIVSSISGKAGGATSVLDIIAAGGTKASGGSGGGGAGISYGGGNGGSDGSDGEKDGYSQSFGLGQGSTTRAFGESTGELFAGGGGGAQENSTMTGGAGGGGDTATAGTPNTGGGGGGSMVGAGSYKGANGGSGIIIIRFRRG